MVLVGELVFAILSGGSLADEPTVGGPTARKYNQAKKLYEANHFEQALALFDQIVHEHPQHELAGYAADLSLDILNLKNDHAGLHRMVRDLLNNRLLIGHHPDSEKRFRSLLPEVYFKTLFLKDEAALKNEGGLSEEKNTDRQSEVAWGWMAFSRELPGCELADKALYNAHVSFERANDPGRAIRMLRRLVRAYPRSDLVPLALERLAKILGRQGRPREEAEAWEDLASLGLAEQGPRGRRAFERVDVEGALLAAARARLRFLQDASVIRDLELFGKRFPDSRRSPEAAGLMKVAQENLRIQQREDAALRKAAAGPFFSLETLHARSRLAELLSRRGFQKEAREQARLALKSFAALGAAPPADFAEARRLAARAETILLGPEIETIQGLRLDSLDPKVLKRAIDDQRSRIVAIEERIRRIRGYGDPEVGSRLAIQVAGLHQDMGDAIRESPRPRGLSLEALEIFEEKLEQLAEPWYQRAQEIRRVAGY
jgi:tetratricopeptide (TPR) repeat protein